ncbi:LacI family DNA-binding transcriptional regulator [Microbacterium sp. H1-D42]|uniref:LacI family DNA-binding transcriptional regulator n=1 Tax=Microbacterium sp. H1-D42 TaxID=2925844 RepID=UPI001F539923|nr:LacI family DNA-binding transcriptional regulator [Microbacterium sp. H1-D42]UNK70696.1 LacI family transcriptional regulator [Microbacterium sp. H1-D42]
MDDTVVVPPQDLGTRPGRKGLTVAKVTIYSIAEELGVHASTVSRAFSRPDLVKDDVRQRVLDTAERLGFQPSRVARRLATGSTGAIGLLVPDITNPFFPPLVREIQAAAGEVTVVLVDAQGSAEAEPALIARLRAQVDGILLASPLASDDVLREAIGSTPTVVLNREIHDLPSVVSDMSTALHAAGDYVYGNGHRRVALLTGTVGSWAAEQRRDAIRAWAATTDVALTELGPFDASYDGGRAAASALLDTDATAAFAFDDLTACGVIAGLAEAGERVPDDRSVIGCDDVLLARVVTPTLSTVRTPNEELAQTAIATLQAAVAGEETASARLEGTFEPRQSIASAA